MKITNQPAKGHAKCNFCRSEYIVEQKDWRKVKLKTDPYTNDKKTPMLRCKFCRNMMVVKIED